MSRSPFKIILENEGAILHICTELRNKKEQMLDLRDKENIIFDLGGVLLNIDYHLTSLAFKEKGFHSFDDFYSQQKQTDLFDLFETGKISIDEFVAEIRRKESGISRSDVIKAWNAMLLDLPKDRLELLRNLKKEFRIFLLSNTNEIHEEAFVRILEEAYGGNVLEEVFETVHLSHKIGYRKPNRDCFNFVLEENGLKPEQTVFIDDSIQHVIGAKNAGIEAFHLQKEIDISQLFPGKFQPRHH